MAYRGSMFPYYSGLVQFFSPLIVKNAIFLYFIWKRKLMTSYLQIMTILKVFLEIPSIVKICNNLLLSVWTIWYQLMHVHGLFKFYIENKIFYKSLPYRMNLFCPDNINQKELWCPRSLQTSRINNSGRRVFLDPKNPSGQALVIFWIQKLPLPSLLMLSVWRDLAHHSSFI